VHQAAELPGRVVLHAKGKLRLSEEGDIVEALPLRQGNTSLKCSMAMLVDFARMSTASFMTPYVSPSGQYDTGIVIAVQEGRRHLPFDERQLFRSRFPTMLTGSTRPRQYGLLRHAHRCRDHKVPRFPGTPSGVMLFRYRRSVCSWKAC